MRYEDIEIGKKYKVIGETDSGHFYKVGDVVEVLGKSQHRSCDEISCQSLTESFHQLLRPEELGEL